MTDSACGNYWIQCVGTYTSSFVEEFFRRMKKKKTIISCSLCSFVTNNVYILVLFLSQFFTTLYSIVLEVN